MKTTIVYKTFKGTTKRYAEWLAKEIDADLFTFREIKDDQLTKYQVIVISSGTYAGWMPLVGFLKKKWPLIKDKKVVVVAVGMAPPDVPWSQKSYQKIPKEIRNKIKYFKLLGFMGGQKVGAVKKSNLRPVIKEIKKG